ncbi:hypothetical protein H1R20_g10303, partial [Candolleomyces eurysporus]
MRLQRSFLLSLQSLLLAKVAFAAFGFTTSGNSINVDTNAGLLFTVNKATGDITSMKFNGIEVQDPGSKKSHINSGIGATCSATRTGNNNNYIKITCEAGTLTHYYVARYNDPAIHMATHITAEPSVGELRFIARLRRAAVPNGYVASDVNGGSIIEGSDVFNLNSQTRSKFYSSRQFIDDQIHGVTGNGIGTSIIKGAHNRSCIINSGHTQTEQWASTVPSPSPLISLIVYQTNRTSSALWFTTGSQPSTNLNTLFWEGLSVKGLVPQSGRGRVIGTSSGVPSKFAGLQVVGFSNSAAQYWTRTDSNGRFTSPYMKPGTYTMTLYKAELGVATKSVTVTAGGVLTSNIASAEDNRSVIWQLGDFDGTPRGFLNADKIETMHPSDARMRSWGPATFTVGDSIANFPMAVFKAIGPLTIKFNLNSNQLGARTLEIATTNAFAGGRPQVKVNNWTGPAPSAPNQPNSRGVTRGTWRGNNIRYTINIREHSSSSHSAEILFIQQY